MDYSIYQYNASELFRNRINHCDYGSYLIVLRVYRSCIPIPDKILSFVFLAISFKWLFQFMMSRSAGSHTTSPDIAGSKECTYQQVRDVSIIPNRHRKSQRIGLKPGEALSISWFSLSCYYLYGHAPTLPGHLPDCCTMQVIWDDDVFWFAFFFFFFLFFSSLSPLFISFLNVLWLDQLITDKDVCTSWKPCRFIGSCVVCAQGYSSQNGFIFCPQSVMWSCFSSLNLLVLNCFHSLRSYKLKQFG